MEEVDALGVEAGSGVELENIILPVGEFFEAVLCKGYFEGVFELMLYLLPQRPQIVLQVVQLLLLSLRHYSVIQRVTTGLTNILL
jgi:hypothetical protein